MPRGKQVIDGHVLEGLAAGPRGAGREPWAVSLSVDVVSGHDSGASSNAADSDRDIVRGGAAADQTRRDGMSPSLRCNLGCAWAGLGRPHASAAAAFFFFLPFLPFFFLAAFSAPKRSMFDL